MKIKKNKNKTKALLKHYIITNRIYETELKKPNYELPAINASEIILNLKKATKIIFEFHKKKKTILFVGLPKNIETKINVQTHHYAIPKMFNLFGVFVNSSSIKNFNFKYFITRQDAPIVISKVQNKPDLIVILESIEKNAIIKESYKSKIPVIQFNDTVTKKTKDKYELYKVPGNFNFNKKFTHNLFFKMINSVLFIK